jgi:hypothetical protein
MNIEHPAYEQRTFYGPLNLAANIPQHGDRYIMIHPDDPSKLVRASGEGVYYNQQEMHTLVYCTQQVLKGLSEHGITHVNPSYIDETGENRQPRLVTIVDKLDSFLPYTDLFSKETLTGDEVYEADHAIGGMLSYIEQAMEEEGYYDQEMMRLDQFVYDASRPKDKKMILVDVEPTGSGKIDMNRDSMKYGYPSPLFTTVIRLCVDAIELSRKAGYSIPSLAQAARVVMQLPGELPETDRAKVELLHALDTCEISGDTMNNLVNGGLWDDEE